MEAVVFVVIAVVVIVAVAVGWSMPDTVRTVHPGTTTLAPTPQPEAADPPTAWVCTRCEAIAAPRVSRRGSGGAEVVLWLLVLLPGLAYSIWRSSGEPVRTCTSCGSTAVVRPDSPAGQRVIAK
jgi:hypothetical protein